MRPAARPQALLRLLLAVALAVAAAPAQALAAPRTAVRWLPPEMGNRWVLEDARTGARRVVTCDAAQGARRHLAGLFSGADLWLSLRASDTATLFERAPSGEWQSFARFGASRAWRFEAVLPGDQAPSTVEARWSGTEWLEVPAGTFPDCRRLALSLVAPASPSSAAALDRAIWFAPDLGVVRVERPSGETLDLAQADVGSDLYPSARGATLAAPPDAATPILESVPDVEQATDYDCGPSALEAILAHMGVAGLAERAISLEAKTDHDAGAAPEDLAAVASRRGVAAEWRDGLTLDDLSREVARGLPVLVLIQAWRDGARAWARDWDDGHYVVVIGVDARAVYIEDPSLKGGRGVIPRGEFLDRWHGWTSDDRKAQRQGMRFRGTPRAPPVPSSAASGTLWLSVE